MPAINESWMAGVFFALFCLGSVLLSLSHPLLLPFYPLSHFLNHLLQQGFDLLVAFGIHGVGLSPWALMGV